jgi:hypothetical protein
MPSSLFIKKTLMNYVSCDLHDRIKNMIVIVCSQRTRT